MCREGGEETRDVNSQAWPSPKDSRVTPGTAHRTGASRSQERVEGIREKEQDFQALLGN